MATRLRVLTFIFIGSKLSGYNVGSEADRQDSLPSESKESKNYIGKHLAGITEGEHVFR